MVARVDFLACLLAAVAWTAEANQVLDQQSEAEQYPNDTLSLLQTRAKFAFSAASQLKTRHNEKCMDYNYDNNNVYMHLCHEGLNQKWYMDAERLTTQYDDKCLDYNYGTNNVYMHPCHGGTNQQWYFEGDALKTRYNDKCLDYDPSSGNIYMYNCHTQNNQKFYWATPPGAALASRVKPLHTETKCLDYNMDSNNVYIHTCHDGKNQKFYLDGTSMKTLYSGKCMDYNFNNNNVYMQNCHGGSNQQWYFTEDDYLKTKQDDKCLDASLDSGNIYMHPCHGGNNQKFVLENVISGLAHDEVADEIDAEERQQAECKDWCYKPKHASKPWEGVKCAWKACTGCTEC